MSIAARSRWLRWSRLCDEIPDVAPALISECRGDVWWLWSIRARQNQLPPLSDESPGATISVYAGEGYTFEHTPSAVYGEVGASNRGRR